jgi:hypothetical protein
MADGEAGPGVGAALGEAGGCPSIEWNGRTWKVGHPTQRAKVILEEMVTAAALDQVERLAAFLPPAKYAAKEKAFLDQLAAGNWTTWGEGWATAINGPKGRHLFALSLLRVHQPDATEADAFGLMTERATAFKAAMVRVVPDFFADLAATFPGPPAAKAAVREEMTAGFLAGLTPSA